jgi:hypothetical protein
MRRGRVLGAVLILVATVGVACGGAAGPSAPTGTSHSTTTVPGPAEISIPGETTAPSTTTAPPALFEFVDYRVSGGTAGVNDDLKVYPDGRVTYLGATSTAPKQSTVPPSTVADLMAALQQANLPALPPVNGTATPDVLQHNVIFGGRSVRFVDGAMPPALAAAVAILDSELARAKAAP